MKTNNLSNDANTQVHCHETSKRNYTKTLVASIQMTPFAKMSGMSVKSIFFGGLAVICLLFAATDYPKNTINGQNFEETVETSAGDEKSAENDEYSKFVKNFSTLSKSEQQEIRSISWAYDRIDERKQKVNELNHEAFLEQRKTKLPDIVIGLILDCFFAQL